MRASLRHRTGAHRGRVRDPPHCAIVDRRDTEPEPPAEPVTRERWATGGMLAAGIAAATSAAIVLAAGFVLALITPDTSILGTVGVDASLVTEAFRHAVGTQLTAMVDPGLLIPGSRRIHPMLLLAIPLGALPHHAPAALSHRGRAGTRPIRLGDARRGSRSGC